MLSKQLRQFKLEPNQASASMTTPTIVIDPRAIQQWSQKIHASSGAPPREISFVYKQRHIWEPGGSKFLQQGVPTTTPYVDPYWIKFLGFPSSVTPDYVSFQIWDSLQGLSTYIRTMLSTQALLSAIGVGEKSATVMGATFQWFLRDFSGMLGGILFTFYQGSSLDSNAKMWRLVADFMNDLGKSHIKLRFLFGVAHKFESYIKINLPVMCGL
ncbi:hypothetical protein GIB67_000645 [Kingdonia uniflora]|uniref:Protein root UVB sensitive/RUS domain-containing protein n=1 Tax=Kingdonia uniflora TaxID=39325 RepID=A0A7J7NCU1_9MAGN|nr:hypothetical protein GIB67_000645 [Kingdonia uniflora]